MTFGNEPNNPTYQALTWLRDSDDHLPRMLIFETIGYERLHRGAETRRTASSSNFGNAFHHLQIKQSRNKYISHEVPEN